MHACHSGRAVLSTPPFLVVRMFTGRRSTYLLAGMGPSRQHLATTRLGILESCALTAC